MVLTITNDTIHDWQQRFQQSSTMSQTMRAEDFERWIRPSYKEWADHASVAETCVEGQDDEDKGLLTGKRKQERYSRTESVSQFDVETLIEDEATLRERNHHMTSQTDGKSSPSTSCGSSPSSYVTAPNDANDPSHSFNHYVPSEHSLSPFPVLLPPSTLFSHNAIHVDTPSFTALHLALVTTGTLLPLAEGYERAQTQLEREKEEFEFFVTEAAEREREEVVLEKLGRRGLERRGWKLREGKRERVGEKVRRGWRVLRGKREEGR